MAKLIEWIDGRRFEVDDNAYQSAIDQGFKPVTQEEIQNEINQEKYGGGASPIIAAGIGAAKEMIPIIGDDILELAGISKEEQGLYEKHNPAAYTTGQVASYVVPAFAPAKALKFFGATGLIEKGSRAIGARLGAATGASAVAAKSMADIAKASGKGAVEFGARGAFEAGAESALNEVENIMDDDFTAESVLAGTKNVLSSIGLGASIGGALGATASGIKTVYNKKAVDAVKNEINDADWLTNDQKLKVLTEFEALRPSRESASRAVIMLKDMKLEPSETLKKLGYTGTIDQIQSQVSDVITGIADQKTPYQYGKDIVENMSDDLKNLLGDAPKIYSEIDDMKLFINVNKKWISKVDDIVNQNMNINHLPKPARNQIKNSLDIIKNEVSDLHDLRVQKSVISNLAFPRSYELSMNDRILRDAYRDVYFFLNSIEDKAIYKAAKDGMFDLGPKKFLKEFENSRKLFNEAYKIIEPYHKDLGLKGPKDLRGILELTGEPIYEKVYKRLLDEKNYEEAKTLRRFFPSGFEESRSAKLNKYLVESTDSDGNLVFGKFQKKLSSMTDEEANILFDLPEYEKTGITGKMIRDELLSTLRSFKSLQKIENPTKNINTIIRDIGNRMTSGIGGFASTVARSIPKAMELATEAAISNQNVMKAIDGAADSFFKVVRRSAVSGLAQSYSNDEIKQAREIYSTAQVNPDFLMERFEQSAGDMKQFPALYEAATEKALMASNFLASEAPKRRGDLLADKEVIPRSELLRYSDFLRAINDPMKVIENIGKGYVNQNELKALRFVYPQIYSKLVQKMMMIKPESLSERQKSDFRQIMGLMRSGNDSARFNTIQAIGTQMDEMASRQGLSGLNISGRTQPESSKVFTRRA